MNLLRSSNSSTKENSRSSTLRLLFANDALSRTEIAAALGISTAAVTMTTKGLLDDGIVVPLEAPPAFQDHSRVGRRQSLLAIHPAWKYILAIEVFPENVNLAVTDLTGTTVAQQILPVDKKLPSAEIFFQQIAESSLSLLQTAGLSSRQLLGAGVSLQGDVNQIDGIALNPYLFKGPVSVRKYLSAALQIPIAVESNVCAALQSELTFRTHIKEHSNVLMLKWGPGVGSAMAIGGNIYKGYRFQSPEIGHNSFSKGRGVRCRCGRRGCLETVISEQVLISQIQRLLRSGKDEELNQLEAQAGPPSGSNFSLYLNSGNASIRKLVYSCMEKLVNAVNNAVIVLAPEQLVLYGQFFRNDTIFETFTQMLKYRNPILPEHFCVRDSLLAEKPYIGCTAIAIEQILFSE